MSHAHAHGKRKASSHPSLQQSSTGPSRWKASSLQQPSTEPSRGKGKRKASSHPSLDQPSAKRARTSIEEEDVYQGDKESDESDYFLVSMKPVWCSGNHSSVSIKPEQCIYISSSKGFSPHHTFIPSRTLLQLSLLKSTTS